MKILVKWSPEPVRVYSIAWFRGPPVPGRDDLPVLFSALGKDEIIRETYESECQILDGQIDDFILFSPDYASAPLVLMWRPLAEAKIWDDLREFDPDAVEHFRQLRIQHGHLPSGMN